MFLDVWSGKLVKDRRPQSDLQCPSGHQADYRASHVSNGSVAGLQDGWPRLRQLSAAQYEASRGYGGDIKILLQSWFSPKSAFAHGIACDRGSPTSIPICVGVD